MQYNTNTNPLQQRNHETVVFRADPVSRLVATAILNSLDLAVSTLPREPQAGSVTLLFVVIIVQYTKTKELSPTKCEVKIT